MVHYLFPSVKSDLKLERRCPNCHRLGGNKHSRIRYRAVSDIRLHAIAQQRMKCPYCSTTWTIRIQGIGHGRQRSDRLITMGVFLYMMLGLSYRAVETFLLAFEWKGSKSSVERDVAQAGQKAKALHTQTPAMRVRILNQLLQHIERTWNRVSWDPCDATNNTTERVIGLTYKIRAKTMRGFKNWDKALAHPYLAQFIRGTEGVCDFGKVV